MPKWETVDIQLNGELTVKAVAPMVISASRRTDIPAFKSDWLLNGLKAGYLAVPCRGPYRTVSFKNTRVIVFWTKDPSPLLTKLSEIDQADINYYFQFTLNDYEAEGFEPNLPRLDQRITSFKNLSELIGKGRVIWRFDPLILSKMISVDTLIDKIATIGNQLHGFTEKLVVSFVDIDQYKRVTSNIKKNNLLISEFRKEDVLEFAGKLDLLNKNWGLEISTCAESADLSRFNITHNKCIDDELMVKLFKDDKKLMEFLGYGPGQTSKLKLKDTGQRKECGCIKSFDIGQYNTCRFQCLYCYATSVSANRA